MTKVDFFHMMKNLPESVSEADIEEMFEFADKNGDGKISYEEFQVMINPQRPAEMPDPNASDFKVKTSPKSKPVKDQDQIMDKKIAASKPDLMKKNNKPAQNPKKMDHRLLDAKIKETRLH